LDSTIAIEINDLGWFLRHTCSVSKRMSLSEPTTKI